MGEINTKELESMLYLLDDTDHRVVEHIESQIIELGVSAIPLIEARCILEGNPNRLDRMLFLIKRIQEQSLAEELKQWMKTEEQDLLDGLLIINKLKDSSVSRQSIDVQLDKIKLDAWLELNYDLTSFEKVKILNHIFFDVHKFKGDTEAYHHSDNSFISSVLERKTGNPISLAIIYSLVAQRLNIPVYGVNLPQHFILGYVKDFDWPPLLMFNDPSASSNEQGGDILFYINPFNSGLIFNHDNIHKFLKQLKLEPKEDYFKACSNTDILLRVLRNLEVSYAKENKSNKLAQVKVLIGALLAED
ncbi:transglutaminase-like domain-containing protein [Bacteroidia bacterium]|jgi:regulator of sirC expression with transglutaminase-like and TPR domain|nr:transglutaminase-like domain-containing protein [Bacteroidia bacterium]